MTMKNRTSCMIIALLLCGAAPALAQTTPATPKHEPLQKAIGQAKPEIVPSLIVMNARGASLQGGKLTLMYGPAVRCKKISSNWRWRSCINVSGL
jgi:hypothetical protein